MATATAPAPITADTEVDLLPILIEALNAPGSLGNTYTRFYNYSFLNQIRLLMQGVNEPVATYKRWQELGFQVQEGTEAKWVLAPKVISVIDKDENGVPRKGKGGKPRKKSIVVGFKYRKSVHPFSNTDGESLPPVELPEWSADAALKGLGVTREAFAHSDGNTQGYSYTHPTEGDHRLAINPAAVFPAKTLFHELAHITLGHTKALKDGAQQDHRGVLEFEAEATAYLVAKELELPEDQWAPAESRAYIDGWLNRAGHEHVWNEEAGDSERDFDPDKLDRHAKRIFGAVNRILEAGRAKAEAQAEAQAEEEAADAA